MTHPEQLVPGRGLKAQLEGFAALGLDQGTMLRAMALESVDSLSEPGSLVRVEAFLKMWESARAQDARPGLPTALADIIPFGAYGLIDYLVGSSETISGALNSLALHFRLATYEAALELEEIDGLHWVRMRPTRQLSDDASEFMTMSILQRLRLFSDGALRVPAVTLTRGAPSDRAIYAAMPVSRFEFSAPVASFAIDAPSWELPLNRADRRLRETLAQVAAGLHLHRGQRSDLELALRARLRDALADQTAEPAPMARMLGVSERTMQRRLAAQDLSFTAVVESFRHEESLRLLSHTVLPLAQVAVQLGFNEQSSFTRAFRRWTGSTPAAWRAAQDRSRDR